jgi:DMSO reductase anchor subunit
LALPLGLVAVFTSVMIYHDTRRTSWRFPRTAARFFGSVLSFAALGHLIAAPSRAGLILLATAVIVKMIPEARIARLASDRNAGWSPDLHSSKLQRGPLSRAWNGRVMLALVAVAIAAIQPWLALPLLLSAELLERKLFFQTVHAPKMPGHAGPARPNHS